ncbi:hypothetical protein [Nocardia jinanensis]|uniref:Uncharacterized protein n=1 Tax=Nocardia jinanensis TaxID=382504 RepID=A0A917VXX9_9NOCA|nr:hypothetical protein [Nocardia jinanensis]GGL43325.1 hypothetical protein GCM10011588_67630 [Nocardia jinanensis]
MGLRVYVSGFFLVSRRVMSVIQATVRCASLCVGRYGPGTYYPDSLPGHPRIHIADAAARTVPLLEAPSGVVVLADEPDD